MKDIQSMNRYLFMVRYFWIAEWVTAILLVLVPRYLLPIRYLQEVGDGYEQALWGLAVALGSVSILGALVRLYHGNQNVPFMRSKNCLIDRIYRVRNYLLWQVNETPSLRNMFSSSLLIVLFGDPFWRQNGLSLLLVQYWQASPNSSAFALILFLALYFRLAAPLLGWIAARIIAAGHYAVSKVVSIAYLTSRRK